MKEDMANKKKLVAIIGPTASGKSDLAKKLIKKFSSQGRPAFGWNGFEVISVDSRQVFKFMDIGTGKDKSFFQHMIDIRNPDEDYSVSQYQQEVYKIIKDIFQRNKIPFLVGGSMLYIDAVLEGYQFPSENRELRAKIEKKTTKEIYQQLEKVDPISAEKNKSNRRRLIRALEVYLFNSRPQSEYKKKKPNFDYLIIGINIPRAELYRRIDERVNQRIKQGMIEEVEKLLKMGVTYNRLQNFGLEYRYLSEYLQEIQKLKFKNQNENSKIKIEILKQRVIQKLKFKIHAFARRQLTWWRKNPEIHWINSFDEAKKLILEFLGN